MSQTSPSKIAILLYNIFQLLGWTYLTYKSLESLVVGRFAVLSDPFFSQVVKAVQTSQYLDLLFSFLGWNSTKPIPSFVHVTGRNLVVWVAFPFALTSNYPLLALIPWSIADVIRFGNYINDSLNLHLNFLKVLRYNASIILYPIGLTGEFTSAGDAKSNIEQQKTDPNVSFCGIELPVKAVLILQVFRLIAYPGLVYMYWHMLKLRSRFYQKEKLKSSGPKAKSS